MKANQEHEDFSAVTSYLQHELKRHDQMRRVVDTLTRIGSLDGAVKEVEARHAQVTAEIADAQAELETAKQFVAATKREAQEIIAKARDKADAIIAEARRKGEDEAARIEGALATKRAELSAASERLAKATEMLR